MLSETSNLKKHDTVVLEKVGALTEKVGDLEDADVLGHFEAGNLVVLLLRNVPVVHAENLALGLGDTGLSQTLIAPGGLVPAQSDTSGMGSIVDAGKLGQGAPAASNIQNFLSGLQLNLLAHNSELVVLELLERLFPGGVRNDTRRVHHTRSQEPGVKVITAIVVVPDLLLILRSAVHEDIGEELEDDEAEQLPGEHKGSPVVTVLEHLEKIAVEVGIAIKVHAHKGLHRHLVATVVLGAILILVEGHIVLDGKARILDPVIDARAGPRCDSPECNEDGEEGDEEKEDGSLETPTQLPCEIGRHAKKQGEQKIIGKVDVAGPIGWQRWVVDGGGLQLGNSRRWSAKARVRKKKKV